MAAPPDVDLLCVGAGFSSIGLATQAIRKYGLSSFELVEKNPDVGGTWYQNTYPGCGCDVPSIFYSFSFEPKSDWTRTYSLQAEIQAYLRGIADRHGITPRIRFRHEVLAADWDSAGLYWRVSIRDLANKKLLVRTARILVSAVGSLSVPNECTIPGFESFQGALFHTAQWDHSFDWSNKNVIFVGNGCSATQAVPVMTEQGPGGPGTPPVQSLIQFARTPHWLLERPNPVYSAADHQAFRYVPLLQKLLRFYIYAYGEWDFQGFHVERGRAYRRALMDNSARYIRAHAPAKYRDFLIPKFEWGCKRKVMDTDYLACLHRDNMTLVHDDAIQEITPTGVRTAAGHEYPADAIVRATGFATHRMLHPMEIRGTKGRTLHEYWDARTDGAPQAYMGTLISDEFPNFFTLMGPNTVTGHTSVVHTVELQIAFTLRLLGPLLSSLQRDRASAPSRALSLLTLRPLDALLVPRLCALAPTERAFVADSAWTQAASTDLVWNKGGCTSWGLHPLNRMNVMMYPDYQWKFWIRTWLIRWGHFVYARPSGARVNGLVVLALRLLSRCVRAGVLGYLLLAGAQVAKERGWVEMVRRSGRTLLGR